MANGHSVAGLVYKNMKGITGILFNRNYEIEYNPYRKSSVYNMPGVYTDKNKLNQTGLAVNYKKYQNFWTFTKNNSQIKIGTHLSTSALLSTDKKTEQKTYNSLTENRTYEDKVFKGVTPDVNISFIPEGTYTKDNLEINLLGELCYSGKYMDTKSSSLVAVNYIQLNGNYSLEKNKLTFNLNPEFGIFLPLNEKYLNVNSSCDFKPDKREDIEVGLKLSLFNNFTFNKTNINTEFNVSCDFGSNNMDLYLGANTGNVDTNNEKFYLGCKLQIK